MLFPLRIILTFNVRNKTYSHDDENFLSFFLYWNTNVLCKQRRQKKFIHPFTWKTTSPWLLRIFDSKILRHRRLILNGVVSYLVIIARTHWNIYHRNLLYLACWTFSNINKKTFSKPVKSFSIFNSKESVSFIRKYHWCFGTVF